MAFTFSLNNIFNRTVDMFMFFKDTWKLNSATVLQSGDGYTVGPSNLADLNGDVLTVADPGNNIINNINNINAWMRIRMPNGHEFLIQHALNTGSNGYRGWYSAAAGFIEEGNGPVSSSVRPTAADEAQICGSSPTGSRGFFSDDMDNPTAFPDYEARQVLNMCFGDADEDYSFYALTQPQGNVEWQGGIFFDSLVGAPDYVESPYVVSILGDDNNTLGSLVGFRNSLAYKTPASSTYAFAWFPGVKEAPQSEMRSCAMIVLGGRQQGSFRYFADNNYPFPDFENEGLTVKNQIHGGYDSLGMALWITSWNDASTNPARHGVLGRSRLFRTFVQTGSRDMTSDLLWRVIGAVGVRWDGLTDPRIA